MVHIAFIDFTKAQQSKIDSAYKNNTEVKLLVKRNQFVEKGNFPVNLTKAQVQQILDGKEITLSKTAVQTLGNRIKNFIKKHVKDKSGGLLPLALAAIPYIAGAAGIAGGVATVVNAVNTKKHQNRIEEETKRHNRAMENKGGRGLYLRKGLKKH
jgi:hypothetical protein